jgi:hypothetical protein
MALGIVPDDLDSAAKANKHKNRTGQGKGCPNRRSDQNRCADSDSQRPKDFH